MARLKQVWHTKGLAIFVLGMFLLSWSMQWLTGYVEHVESGASGNYLWPFLQATFENWQSEFFQVGVFVVASALLYYVGSPQSKDSDEQTQRDLEEVKQMLREVLQELHGKTN